MTATKTALQTATAARQTAEASGDRAAIREASIAEMDAWAADFDARHSGDETECSAPTPVRVHRVGDTAVCRDCKVRELRTREAALVANIRENALSSRGGAATALRGVRRQLGQLAQLG